VSAPGRFGDLPRFSKGRVDPYGGQLLPDALTVTFGTTICIACLHQPNCMSRKTGDLRSPEPMTVRAVGTHVRPSWHEPSAVRARSSLVATQCSAKTDIGARGSSMQGTLLTLLCFAKP
jgi:hypothetical protein